MKLEVTLYFGISTKIRPGSTSRCTTFVAPLNNPTLATPLPPM